MGIPILSVRDDQGNIIPIPAIQGRDGVDGKDGKDGAAGPNLINADTLTPMAGILMGSSGSVKTAVSGTDYATPAEVAAKVGKDDYTRTINTATTTGTASNYILTLDPAPDALVQGMMLLVNFHVGSDSATVPPMLNVKGLGGNDFGAKYLFPVGQNSGKPFAAGVHIIFYDGEYWRMLDNAFLPIVGGTVYGSITPSSAMGFDLGSSAAPWRFLYATTAYITGALTVNGNNVWHNGNLPIQSASLSLTSGWEYNRREARRIGDVVTILIHARSGDVSNGALICTLPVGMRPTSATVLVGMAMQRGNNLKRCTQVFIVNPNGELTIADGVSFDGTTTYTGDTWIAISASFII